MDEDPRPWQRDRERCGALTGYTMDDGRKGRSTSALGANCRR
jgi:hypothetical protein